MRIDRLHEILHGLSIDGDAVIIWQDVDPTVTSFLHPNSPPIPPGSLLIRSQPAQLWQKQSLAEFDWVEVKAQGGGNGGGNTVPFITSDGSETQLATNSSGDLDFITSDGTQISIPL